MNARRLRLPRPKRADVLATAVFFGLLIGVVLVGTQLAAIWWWPVRRFDIYAGLVGGFFLASGLWVGLRAGGLLRSRLPDGAFAGRLPEGSGPDAPDVEGEAPAAPGAGGPMAPPLEPLTPREREILASLAAGFSNAEIADKHFVSLNTVKTHLRQIYGKLEVTRRVQAVGRARRLGLIE